MGDKEPKVLKGILKKPKEDQVKAKPSTQPVERPCRENEDIESRISEPRSRLSHERTKTPVPRQTGSAKLKREPTPPTPKAKQNGRIENGEVHSGYTADVDTPTPETPPKQTPPDGKKRLSIKEIRELRAEVVRRRRQAKGEFPDHDDIKPRRPGQLPWRKKQELSDVDITKDEEFDSDLEEELKLLKLAGTMKKSAYDHTGKLEYLAACKKYATTPISTFIRNIENNKFILRYRGIASRGARALAAALEINPRMEYLILTGNFIDSEGGFYISEALRDNQFIIELDLSENCLGGVGACAICDMLCDNKFLVTLDLSGNALEDSDAPVFQEMLMNNHSLKTLRLAYNHFENLAGNCFGEALAENVTLETLDLSWNHIRLKGATALCRGVQENIGLKHLDLSMNGLGIEGAKVIAEAIKVNRTLLDLDVSRNRIPEAGGILLGQGLKVNETMKVFRCARNPILPDGAMSILQSIEKNEASAMEFLDLSDDFVRKNFVELKDKLEVERVMRILHGSVINDDNFGPELGLIMEVKEGIMDDPMTKLRNYCDKAGLRLIDLFKQFDKDQSMSLTRAEIKRGIKTKKIKMSAKEIDRLLDHLDTDGDGEVDYAELVFGDKLHRGVKRRVKAMNIERTRRLSLVADDPTIRVVEKKVGMSELVEEVMWIEDNRADWNKKVAQLREKKEEEVESDDEDTSRRKGILSGTA